MKRERIGRHLSVNRAPHSQDPDDTASGQASHACPAGEPPDARATSDDVGKAPERLRVLNRILAAHEAYFDVRRDYEYSGRIFDGYAEFHSHGQKYVLVKRATLWEVDTHEYAFFCAIPRLDLPWLREATAFMETEALRKVDPKPNHMSSAITLVVVADRADDDAWRELARTRFRKSFSWGIRGWSDLRLAAADLSRNRATANGAAKPLIETVRSCMP